MSENNKPIFPRQPDNINETNQNAEKALENLVKTERYTTDKGRLIFCNACNQQINFEDIICPHCGQLGANKRRKSDKNFSDNGLTFAYGPPIIPAYGPPPLPVKIFRIWIVLLGLVLFIALIVFAIWSYLSLR